MKIGILTYHRAINYGAVLQAFALNQVLTDKGYDVKIVDYWSSDHSILYSVSPLSIFFRKKLRFRKKIKSFLFFWLTFPIKFLRKKKFQMFLKSNFQILGPPQYLLGYNIVDDCDLYIYGSDQIWWYDDFLSFNWFDGTYWWDFPISQAKKISYAASMWFVSLDVQKKLFIERHLLNFYAISVREEELKVAIQWLTDKPIEKVLDPVFLLSAEQWVALFCLKKRKKRYVLLYDFLGSKKTRTLAKNIANVFNIELIEISKNISFFSAFSSNIYRAPSVNQFLDLFYSAEFVVTSSFHWLVFSIIFEKNFYVMDMWDSSNRALDLLDLLDLQTRYIDDINLIDEYPVSVSYFRVSDIISLYRNKSLVFLFNNIESI